jgi:serine-type D-Ala-D-Ala carboxypeptidase (penicillin-binding protein 5/6)
MANPTNVSTAHEMAVLTAYCMQMDTFSQIVGTQKYFCNPKNDSKYIYGWHNTNALLEDPFFNGCKTGITEVAGPCLATGYCGPDRS